MTVDIDALAARAAALAARVEELNALLRPIQAELVAVQRKIVGARTGRISAQRRKQAAAERNRLICDEARELGTGRAYIPIFWQQQLANKHGISGRQVRRILEVADIKVGRYS